MVIKWKVSEKPTGNYSSFQKRDWPSAHDGSDNAIADLRCEDDYTPALAKGALTWTGKPPVIHAYVADWSNWNLGEARDKSKAAFVWMHLKETFNNVTDAKHAVTRILTKHPEYFRSII